MRWRDHGPKLTRILLIASLAIVTVLAGCGGPTDDYTAAFDDPGVSELRVFNLGDGGAMSGILVAGRRAESADATLLVFLLD